MKKRKGFYGLLAFLVAAMLFVPAAFQGRSEAAKKVTPGTVKMVSASPSAYNKITVKWNKTKNATHYKIYYKKSGDKSWKYVYTTGASKSSYTHVSSKKAPITVGQKYTYTVKAYNKKYNTTGKYDSKGKTTATKPSTVKLNSAKLNSNKTVTIKWNKTNSCDSYKVYRKTGSSGWKCIATTKSTSYTDKKPVKGAKNTYTVRSYYSKTKALGNYNTKGISVSVPGSSSSKVKKLTITPNLALLEMPGDTMNLSVKVSPSNASKSVTWKSSDTDVVKVSNGKLTAVAKGTATVIATATDGSGVKGECEVFVLNDKEHDDSKVYDIVIDSYIPTLISDGATTQLQAHVEPSTASNQGILWAVEILEGAKNALTIDAYGTLTAHGKMGDYAVGRVYAKSADNPDIYTFVDVTMDITEDVSSFPEEVLRLTNIERTKRGIPPVQYHEKVQQAAMIRAKELEIRFAHTRPNGEDNDSALWEVGTGGGLFENINRGAYTPQNVITSWMNSPGHRNAILDRDSNYLGVGFHEDASGRRYWVQMFVDDPDITYTLSFDTMGGSSVEDIVAHKAELISVEDLPIPTKHGYKFAGWYFDSGYHTKFEGGNINKNRTYYAKWIPE